MKVNIWEFFNLEMYSDFENSFSNLTINVNNDDFGWVEIAGATIDVFPYDNSFYNSVPIYLTAKPKEGFEFVGWQQNGLIISNSKFISINLDLDSTFTAVFNNTTVSTDEEVTPQNFDIYGNFPNPFNSGTSLQYVLNRNLNVKIKIYDISGNEIRDLLHEYQSQGHKSIFWNAKNNNNEQVSSGLYIYAIEAGAKRETKKMLFVK